jgi:hypothetical protein
VGNANRKNKRNLLVAAIAPAAVAMIAGDANASITANFVKAGAASGGAVIQPGGGWTAFRLVATADTGDVIAGVDFTASGQGIFGTLLQRWVYISSSSTLKSPAGAQQNNGVDAGSLDSHFITLSGQTYNTSGTPFTEDNPQNLPTFAGDTANARYGTGTNMHVGYAITSGFLATQPLAYVVFQSGTNASATFTVSERPSGGGQSTAASFTLPLNFIEPGLPPIVSLSPVSGGTPIFYGNKLSPSATPGVDQATFDNGGSADGIIHLLGSSVAGYVAGHANNIGGSGSGGESQFYTEVSGWNPATDIEIFALNVKVNGADPTLAQDSAIVDEINARSIGNITASVLPGGQYASVFPGYDILLTAVDGMTSPEYLGFDFPFPSGTDVTVTDIAVVPEPASLAAVLPAAAGLLLGRRKRAQ